MKKRSAKKENAIKRIFNRMGMTYIELICALALLSLVVVMFTPMLLSSYENLYKAGEKIEAVYDSREEMEQGLARRDSAIPVKMNISLTDNAMAIFDSINVRGRKVVSSMQDGFETVFGQVRAKVEIVSPKTVYDDQTNHTIVLQTSGIDFSRVTFGKMAAGVNQNEPDTNLGQDQIHIEAIIPDKSINVSGELDTTSYQSVYGQSTKFAQVKYVDHTGKITDFSQALESSDAIGGRIRVNLRAPAGIDPLDFTQSPIQVNVYYRNTRGKLRVVSDYLYIEAPSLIMAGDATSTADYYTSAGVDDQTSLTRTGTRTLTLEARKMRISNSPYAKSYFGTPSQKNVQIRSIRWIDNDETPGLKPYYIMTGTNCAIYRMYNYASNSSEIYKNSVYKVIKNNPNAFYNGINGSEYNNAIIASAKSAVDGTFTTTDGTRVFPSLWSGDFSHAFDYSTAIQKINYAKDENGEEDGCWISSDRSNFWKGAEKFNVFGMQTQMSYYYNGDACDYAYNFQNQRTISYVLNETGYALRMFGLMKTHGDYTSFNSIWSAYYTQKGKDKSGMFESVDKYNLTSASDVYAFAYDASDTGTLNDKAEDYVFAAISIKFLASYNLADLDKVDSNNDYFLTGDQYKNMSDMARLPVVRIDAGNTGTGTADRTCGEAVKVNVTDSIYLPSANGVAGTTFYVGNTSGYANIAQKDNYSTSSEYAKTYRNAQDFWGSNKMSYPKGAVTDFLILSNDDGTGTYITAYNDNDSSRDGKDVRKSRFLNASDEVDAATTASTDAQVKAFYYPTNYNTWKSIYLDDVYFTFGYSSNRERVYKNITYDGVSEKYRSFENFYFLSHYGTALTDTRTLNRDVCNSSGTISSNGTYSNSYNNDFYNVWFPGEMYNLSKIASKDGVTVAVGYAVSGSTYQFINPSQTTNTSTALGGIYNDGVLAAMIDGKHSAFNNILYFKDNETMDTTSLKGKTGYNVYTNGNYGLHTRQSVQFTAVDLMVENIRGTTTDNNGTSMTADAKLNYYAIYGDNRGRLFKSLVATAKGTIDTEAELNAASAGAELVPFIKDRTFAGNASGTYTVGNQNIPYSTMEEIKINYGGTEYPISVAFSEIKSITAYSDLVVVTGTPNAALNQPESFVIGQLIDGQWNWKWIINGDFKGVIEDADIVNGYYYFVGYDKSINSSFLGSVPLETLRNISGEPHENVLKVYENTTNDPNGVLWVRTNSTANLYAIAGRTTN